MWIVVLAALAMVVQDILGTIMVQAEAANRGWLAGWMDTLGWLAAITTTSISVTAIQGHDTPRKVAVIIAVSLANLFGTKLGQIMGKRLLNSKMKFSHKMHLPRARILKVRMSSNDVPAHDQHEVIHLVRHYPEHSPRTADPNYHLFEETKTRLKKQGLWKCVIATADCEGPISLHHSHFEFAYINEIDVPHAQELFGLHLDDAAFQAWIEGPGNLEPLCFKHHMGDMAVHMTPAADWDIVRAHTPGEIPIQRDTTSPEAAQD